MIYLEKPIECLFTTGSQIDFTDLQRTRTTVCNSRVSSIIRDFNSKLIKRMKYSMIVSFILRRNCYESFVSYSFVCVHNFLKFHTLER